MNEGFAFETGFVCENCGAALYDIPMYDAKGCFACDAWADHVCSDPDCPVCSKRPATPLGAAFDMDEADGRRRVVYRALGRKRSLQDNYFHKTNGRERRRKRILYKKTDK